MDKDRQTPSPGDHAPDGKASSDQITHRFGIHEDYIVAAVILLLSVVVIGITTTFESVPAALSQGVPPEQFPRLTVGLIIFLTVVMVFQARTRPEKKHKPVPAMAYSTGALLVALVAVIDWIGTVAAMVVFCVALPVMWGERRYLLIATYAILFPAAIYLLFSQMLEVRFPAGFLDMFLR